MTILWLKAEITAILQKQKIEKNHCDEDRLVVLKSCVQLYRKQSQVAAQVHLGIVSNEVKQRKIVQT